MNNAASKKENGLRRNIIGVSLRGVVFRGCPHEDHLYSRLERNGRMLEQTEDNIKSLCQIAEDLVQSIERDYELIFLRGQHAWDDRVKKFAV